MKCPKCGQTIPKEPYLKDTSGYGKEPIELPLEIAQWIKHHDLSFELHYKDKVTEYKTKWSRR